MARIRRLSGRDAATVRRWCGSPASRLPPPHDGSKARASTGTSTNRRARTLDRGGRRGAVGVARSTTGTSASPTSATDRTRSARVLDDHGALIDARQQLRAPDAFNVGPTLMSWLEDHRPRRVRARSSDAERDGRRRDRAGVQPPDPAARATSATSRTQVRWGLADFALRFGRPAEGMWLPETAVNDEVLSRARRGGRGLHDPRSEPSGAGASPRRGRRRVGLGRRRVDRHPAHLPVVSTRAATAGASTIVFYDGGLSHDVAFGLDGLSSAALVDRAEHLLADRAIGGVVCIATDGETFGHHHRWGERAVAYALAVEAPRTRASRRADSPSSRSGRTPEWEVQVRESAWSCAHGVGRWKEDCGCHTGGGPGWHQAWRAPLRAAFDRIRDHGVEVFERRGGAVLHDPWAARDAMST